MRSVCIWGTSLKKVADEAQVDAIVKILQTRLPQVQITLFSQDARELVAQHSGVEAMPTRDLRAMTRALRRADLLLFVGGPFFESVQQAGACTFLLALAALLRVPVIAYGATLFRFETWWGRPWFRAMFGQLRAIGVRERVALDILRDLDFHGDVSLFADPRFVLEPASKDRVHSLLAAEGVRLDLPCVTVTTRHFDERVPNWVKRSNRYSAQRAEATKESLARAIDALDPQVQVLFLPMHPDYQDDMRDARAIQERLRQPSRARLLSRRFSASEALGIIAQSDLLLASRVGSAVFASVTGTPVVGIAHEPRMTDHLQRMNLGDCVFDWRSLDPAAFAARVGEVWKGREAMRARVRTGADEMTALAWRNADVVLAELEERE